MRNLDISMKAKYSGEGLEASDCWLGIPSAGAEVASHPYGWILIVQVVPIGFDKSLE